MKNVAVQSSLPHVDFATFGKGPFAIGRTVTPELKPLTRELMLLGKNTRPDVGENRTVMLGLKSHPTEREIVCGETIFLKREGEVFTFTDKETDLSITPLSLEGNDVLLQVDWGEKREELILATSSLFQNPLEEELYMQTVKKGKMWGVDLFLTQCGGEEYTDLTSKHKIELDSQVYFVKTGDYLWWDGDRWQVGDSSSAPLVKIGDITTNGLQLHVWDPKGFSSSTITLPLQQVPPFKQDEIMTAVRPRSPTEITCQLGKRRVIVKEGDWWVKGDGKWRPLKTTDDLEAFLYHKIQGELFIFDKIENNKGKIVLRGKSFDKMRTQSKPVAYVFNTEKKQATTFSKNETGHPSLIAKGKMTSIPIQSHQNDEPHQ